MSLQSEIWLAEVLNRAKAKVKEPNTERYIELPIKPKKKGK